MIIDGVELDTMTLDGVEVQTWMHDGVEVYSAGRLVHYHVDTGVEYVEKIKKGMSALSPTTFSPEKDGWEFAGWREDATASEEWLSEKVVEKSEITLYAVFKQAVTLSYDSNGGSGSVASQTEYKHYNNGDVLGALFTLNGNSYTKTNMTFQTWAAGSASGTQHAAGAEVRFTEDTTLYAAWAINVLNNKVWRTGSGAGEWTGSYDFTNYTTVTVKLVFNKCYQSIIKAVSPVSARDEGSTDCEVTFTPQSGSQSFEWQGKERPEYGINSADMTWTLYITAS